MKESDLDLAETWVRILNKSLANQRQPRRYGLDELLYPAEMHLIMLIAQNPSAGVTELALKGGVTKGAVSQMAHKLEEKGLITKQVDPENATRVIFSLSNKGRVAFYSHERLHEESDAELLDFIGSLKPGQLQTLKCFLQLVEQGIDKRNET